jgi:exodeoxyribonuclease-5
VLAQQFKAILWTATTGKAALRLRELLGTSGVGTPRSGAPQTLHRALYAPPGNETQRPTFKYANKPPKDAEETLLVVDEASMIAPDVWDDLQSWVKAGVRVLFVGDSFQLPPVVEKGQDFSIFETVRGPELTQVMRSGDDILYAATVLREEGRLLRESRGKYEYQKVTLGQTIGEWLADRDEHALITWRNKIRMTANRVIRKAGKLESVLPVVGEPILLRKNGQGFLNGEIVTAQAIEPWVQLGPVTTHMLHTEGRRLMVSTTGKDESMDGAMPFLAGDAWKKYVAAKGTGAQRLPDPTPITWGYALTCHAGQGSEWRRVTVYIGQDATMMKVFSKPSILPGGRSVPFWTRWTYTALTRAKDRATVVIGQEA